MDGSNLKQLRDQVRRAHQNATRKVSRIRAKGVEIGGTSADPRRAIKNVGRYTEKQLRAYLRELDQFRSRSVQYLPAASPQNRISAAAWREYKKLEREYNEIANRSQKQRDDVFLPSHGMTIGDRDDLMRSMSPRAGGQRRPLDPIVREHKNIRDDKALQVLIRDMRKRVKPSYERSVVRQQKANAIVLAGESGSQRFASGVKGLTQKQFNILWNYTDFATMLSHYYETRNAESTEWIAKTRKDMGSSIDELLSWAKTI